MTELFRIFNTMPQGTTHATSRKPNFFKQGQLSCTRSVCLGHPLPGRTTLTRVGLWMKPAHWPNQSLPNPLSLYALAR